MTVSSEALELGVEAYIYLYPLVTMDVTRRILCNVPPDVKPGMGPAGAFHHMRAFPDAKFKAIVRPNFDTLYSSAWLDLTQGPVVMSAPDMHGRYYQLPIYDMWSDAFAAPGTRTSGSDAGCFVIVPPGWQGALPPDMERIDAPTPYVWIIGRTQTNGPADYAAVHAVQDCYGLTPLARWPNRPEPAAFTPDPTVDLKTPTLDQVNNMPGREYFTYAAELMKLHRPHVTDWSQVARRRRIGLHPGQPFTWDALTPEMQEALEAAPAAALKSMRAKLPKLARVVNGWQMNTDSMGVYGDYYLKRAIVAMVGLGANQEMDAIYPMAVCDAAGKPLDGANNYVLHFAPDELPPMEAFWSITMYDADGFQAENELDRFAIGDRDALRFNADGSLDIYMQHENPGGDKTVNWLPAPLGPLGITMRLYAPRSEALDGRWAPPAIQKMG